MKKTYVAFLFLLLGTAVRAQTKPAEGGKTNQVIRICSPSRNSLIQNQPLFVVNGIATANSQTIIGIAPSDIESVTILKSSDSAIKNYPVNKNGTIVIGLKKGVAFLPLNKALRKVNKKDRELSVYLNDEKLISREDFYLSENRIEAVKVVERPGNDANESRVIQIFLKP